MGSDTRERTIPRLVLGVARFGDREAVVDGDVRMNYVELVDEVRRFAGAVIAQGLQPGDRVAVWAPNGHRWIVAALGAVSAGAVLVPLNTRYRGEEAAWVLRRSRAALLVVSDVFLGNDYLSMLATQGPFPDLRLLVVLAPSPPVGGALAPMTWPDFLASSRLVPAQEVERRMRTVVGDDPADAFFTSGTTGRPKGAVTTHAQNLRTMESWADVVGLADADRYLIVNPFFHTFGYKAGVIASLLRGATMIPHQVLDVPAVLACVESERVSVLPGPPTLYQSILDAPRGDRDLASLRLAVTGAAMVPIRLIERLHDEMTFTTVITAYGLTETTGVVTMCRPDDDALTVATTSGRAIPDVEVRVIDAAGTPLPPGQAGEVVVRGYNVMLGYLDDPDATDAAVDADGWLHTGDIGTLDQRGYLRIVDRVKDMYICGGFNVYPAEVEQVIARLEAVTEVAVIGGPDDRLGEVGVAFVVARAGACIDEQSVIEHCRAHLANFKVPRQVWIVDGLPRNAGGKVLKRELRQRLPIGDRMREVADQ
jgi:acyl-CoA synthetase (AMP-forming)/AMP-acid ligase II